MSKKEIVDTIHGRRSKYEIVRDHDWAGSVVFRILKGGASHGGSYKDLRDAVERAQADADEE